MWSPEFVKRSKKLTISTLVVYFSLVLLVSIFYVKQIEIREAAENQIAKISMQEHLEHAESLFSSVLIQMTNTVLELAKNTQVKQLEIDNQDSRYQLTSTLDLLMHSQKFFYQLRFIDPRGEEVIRLENASGIVTAIPEGMLQNKLARDYISQSLQLRAGDYKLYGIDLEKEYGMYLTPYQSALRIVSPIHEGSILKGFIVANVNLNELHRYITKQIRPQANLKILFSDSSIALSSSSHELFGTEFIDHRSHNLNIAKPELWQKIQELKQGAEIDDLSVCAFQPLIRPSDLKDLALTLLIEEPVSSALNRTSSSAVNLFYQLALFTITLIAVTIYFVLYYFQKMGIENSLAAAALNSVAATIVTDKRNNIIKVNDQFTRINGYPEAMVLGKNPSMFSSKDRFKTKEEAKHFYQKMWDDITKKGVWEGELTNIHRAGFEIILLVRIQVIKDKKGKIVNYVASFVDISERKYLELELVKLSERDSLSECWNRRKFDKEIKKVCSEFKRYPLKEPTILAILDIDLFKNINDEYGHDKGDEVIRLVGDTLNKLSRDTDFVARIGGEEFAVILPFTQPCQGRIVLERMCNEITAAADINVTLSAGFTLINAEIKLSYKQADKALYAAKNSGRNQVVQFEHLIQYI